MKKLTKILALLLALSLLLGTVALLASCGGDDECTECVDANTDGKCDNCGATVEIPASETKTYTLTVTDGIGTAPTIVIYAELYKNGNYVEQKKVENGTVSFTQPAGDYTVTLAFQKAYQDKYYYNSEEATFSATKDTASVTLYKLSGPATFLNVPCIDHKDEDGNYRCDLCNGKKHCGGFSDATSDGVCDTCGKRVACSVFIDNDNDTLCDRCGVADHCISFVDDDSNARCDICDEAVPCVTPVDSDSNGKCDICNLTADHCTVHVKEEGEKRCSVCRMLIPCNNYVDENCDAQCDDCGATVHCLALADENADGECDNCGDKIHCTVHVNPSVSPELDDSSCDLCSAIVPCESYVDLNCDAVCDTCGAMAHCTSFVDNNKDGACDKCRVYFYDINGRVEYNAVELYEGASILTVDRPLLTYFIFTPTRAGTYKISYVSDSEAVIGNYGVPNYVQRTNLSPSANGSFTVNVPKGSVSDGIGGTVKMVYGIATEAEKVVIKIERIGEAEEPVPFDEYPVAQGTGNYAAPINDKYVDLDITDETLTVVYNETDGYYHYLTKDGPIVFVKITTGGNTNIPGLTLPALSTIIESDHLCAFFYDDNNTLIKKESYNAFIQRYAELSGASGMRPLDKDMAYVLKKSGETKGWWDTSSSVSIFGDAAANVVEENAWLFACAYAVSDSYGTASAPATVTPESATDENGEAVAPGNFAVRVSTEAVTISVEGAATLTFKNAAGVTVTYNGTDYTATIGGTITVTVAENAVLTVTATAAQTITFTAVKTA